MTTVADTTELQSPPAWSAHVFWKRRTQISRLGRLCSWLYSLCCVWQVDKVDTESSSTCTVYDGTLAEAFLGHRWWVCRCAVLPLFHDILAIVYFSKMALVLTCSFLISGGVIEFRNRMFERFGFGYRERKWFSVQIFRVCGVPGGTKYSAQYSSQVERFNRVMKNGLCTGLADCSTTGFTRPGVRSGAYVPDNYSTVISGETRDYSSPVKARILFRQLRMSGHHDRRHRTSVRRSRQAIWYVSIWRFGSKHRHRSTLNRWAVGNTEWLANGQRRTVRRCLRYRHVAV